MRLSWRKVKSIISITIFVLIIAFLVSKISWIFRGNGSEAREDIGGFKNQGNVDVVLYAGSNLLRYYQPLEAWNSYGYTSYNYATSSAKADLLKEYIEESRTCNEALLYVCDIRSITMVNETVDDSSVRNWSDSLPLFSWVRAKGISSFLFTRDWGQSDVPSFYLDLIKYHSNYDALSSEYQWSYINSDTPYNIDKGFSPNGGHVPFQEPTATNELGQLTQQQTDAMNKLLNYCDKENLNVLFICCPYIIPEREWKIINSCGAMIESRGYNFINFNEYYDEIGIDFETDFGDVNHVNFLGAEKYTSYLMDYLSLNYNLPDHRGDSEYEQWNADYLTFTGYQETWRSNIQALVENHLNAKNVGNELKKINNTEQWLKEIQNSNYTIFIEKDSWIEIKNNEDSVSEILKKWDIDFDESYYIGVWSGEKAIYSENSSKPYGGNVGTDGGRGTVAYNIQINDGPKIEVGSEDYRTDGDGIHIVVFDNNFEEVWDSVTITYIDGEYTIER